MTIRPHPDPATPDATWRDVPVVGFTVAAGIAAVSYTHLTLPTTPYV